VLFGLLCCQVAEFLTQEFYDRNYTIRQRLDIVEVYSIRLISLFYSLSRQVRNRFSFFLNSSERAISNHDDFMMTNNKLF